MDLNLKYHKRNHHEAANTSVNIFNWKKVFGKEKQEEEEESLEEKHKMCLLDCYKSSDLRKQPSEDLSCLPDVEQALTRKNKEEKKKEKEKENEKEKEKTILTINEIQFTALGNIYETCLYNPDAPFHLYHLFPSELADYCNKALEQFNKIQEDCCYKFVHLFKAWKTCISSFSDFNLIFAASLSDGCAPETFEATVRAGFQFHQNVRGYAVVVTQVRQISDRSIGHNPRVCIYGRGIRCPSKSDLMFMCEAIIRSMNIGVQRSNDRTAVKQYKFLELLCAYYTKRGPSRYFDVRFKAIEIYLHGVVATEIFEAETYFIETAPNGSWSGGGLNLLGISRGKGSRFDDDP